MKKTAFLGFAVAAIVSMGANAERHIFYDYGTVIDTVPITKHVNVSTPREECWEEEVVYRDVYRDDYRDNHHNSGISTVIGAVVGGAIGNAVGHSRKNKQVGAVIGAVLGGTLGHAIADNRRRSSYNSSYTETEEVCRVYYEYHEEERVIGYRVRYRYNSETYSTRTDVDPGDTIKLRLALSPVI